MEEAMAEGGTMEENMVEVTVEEGVEEGTVEEGTKEGMAAEGREATAEVDTGVEPFITAAPKAAWFTLHNVEGFQEGLQSSGKCEGRSMVWETCEVREENCVRTRRPLTHLILHSMMPTYPYSQRPSR
jgi:hypothetical protein